jgi:hypothetical protein
MAQKAARGYALFRDTSNHKTLTVLSFRLSGKLIPAETCVDEVVAGEF